MTSNVTHKATRAVININGDTAKELINQHKAVHAAALALQKALLAARPHGRNYPCGGYEVDRDISDIAWFEVTVSIANHALQAAIELQNQED